MLARILKILFFAVIVKPVVLFVLGLNIRNRSQLPDSGPAIIAANHNSHLDTMVLMAMYPLSQIHRVRPVAAADYFLANKALAWFSLNVIGIIPLTRDGGAAKEDLFAGCHKALENGDIVILFPEGSRGEPEQMSQIKKGLYHLVQQQQRPIPVTPVVMRGLGRALPRGEALLVPFNCDVIIGEKLADSDSADTFVTQIQAAYDELFQYCITSSDDL